MKKPCTAVLDCFKVAVGGKNITFEVKEATKIIRDDSAGGKHTKTELEKED